MKKRILIALALCSSLLAYTAAFAQDRTTEGSIGGQITDQNGGAIPNAKITVTGPTGERTVNTNGEGVYEVLNLIPGTYTVKVEQSGFKTATDTNVTVFVGKQATVSLKLEAGNVAEVVNVTGESATDLSSTAVGENLNDQLYQNIPVQRSVSSLFYLAPGVTGGLGAGNDNPSISGGSGLDNLYIADGVNITDTAFGGIGVFSRNYGALGTGINTSFIKEVQVKTGGFEAQYGQSEGGIVNIITQSGSNAYHGAFYGYARPQAFEAERRQVDPLHVNKLGELLHQENYDVGADFGGYVPGARDHLFFFGSFNPTIRRDIVQGAEGSGLLTLLGQTAERYRTLNYAFKTDYNINPNHQISFSIFGDPTKTNLAPFRTLNTSVLTSRSVLDFGTRNLALRYNGSLGPSASPLTISALFSQGKNHIDETGFTPFSQITDYTQLATRGAFNAIGLGFIENTQGKTNRFEINISKQATFLGTHTFGIGYQYSRANFGGLSDYTGPRSPIPATNADMTYQLPPEVVGQSTSAAYRLRLAPGSCTLCPFLTIPGVGDRRVDLQAVRGRFGDPTFNSRSNYNAGYIQDTYRVNKYITAVLGLRTEQERIIGKNLAYSFTDQWAPRLGVTVDPFGKGKTKFYYNYARYFEYLPLDAAERSLSTELDFYGQRLAPDFTTDANGVRHAIINQYGTVTPVLDAAHLLNRAAGGVGGAVTVSTQSNLEAVLPGTKLGFKDEQVVGFEQQLPKNYVLSVRYIHRNLKRLIEDAAILSPEAALAGVGQLYFIGNIGPSLDAGVNLVEFAHPISYDPNTGAYTGPIPAGCAAANGQPLYDTGPLSDPFGNPVGAACFAQTGIDPATGNEINTPDGKPDGFPAPVQKYNAVEIELNKRFSNGYQILTNFRFSSLRGNYEGHLRNDNGQTDPGISSLFDFTAGIFNLLGDQFAVGPLNTDRRFVANIYGSYAFSKTNRAGFLSPRLAGLNLGLGVHMESGIPLSEFYAHPVYQNAGEIPVGGRGKLGRTPFYTRLDLHADYPIHFKEKYSLKLVADFFNVTNSKLIFSDVQFRELGPGVLDQDFGTPSSFRPPFNMRLGLRFEF